LGSGPENEQKKDFMDMVGAQAVKETLQVHKSSSHPPSKKVWRRGSIHVASMHVASQISALRSMRPHNGRDGSEESTRRFRTQGWNSAGRHHSKLGERTTVNFHSLKIPRLSWSHQRLQERCISSADDKDREVRAELGVSKRQTRSSVLRSRCIPHQADLPQMPAASCIIMFLSMAPLPVPSQ